MKKFIALITLSLIVIFGLPYAQKSIQMLINAHEWVSQILQDVFTGGPAGNVARGLLALLTIPFVMGLIPLILYWMIRRLWFPYFMDIVWIVWLIQLGALLQMYQSSGIA